MGKRYHSSLQAQGHEEEGWPLSHACCGLSPWVPLPCPEKALHDYETVTADKKPELRERNVVGSHVLSQLSPGSFSLVRIRDYQIRLKIATGCLWGAEG